MHLTDLPYLQTIARGKNLTSAARPLGVQQPTRTVALQRLAAEVGTPLFLRDRTGGTLTSPGKAFVQYVTEALTLLPVGVQHVQGLERDEVGSFILGGPRALGSYFLPPFLLAFLRESPRIEGSLQPGSREAPQRALLARAIHCGLLSNPTPPPELVLTRRLHEATELFMAAGPRQALQAPDVAASQPGSVDWEAACARLRTGPLVDVAYMPQAQAWRERLGAAPLLSGRQLRCEALALATSLAVVGVGIAILPRRVAASDPQPRLGRGHPAWPFMHEVVYLAYRADLHRTRAAMPLTDALVEHGCRLGHDAERRHLQQEIA